MSERLKSVAYAKGYLERKGTEEKGEGTGVIIRDIIDQGCFSIFYISTFLFSIFFGFVLFQYYSLVYLSIFISCCLFFSFMCTNPLYFYVYLLLTALGSCNKVTIIYLI